MAVIPQGIDADWHESHLRIQVMNIGPVPRKELFNRVREQQGKKVVLGEKGITHSRRAYKYWLDDLIDNQIAIEGEGQPRLTALGKWIANSQTGTLEDRYLFICNLTCLDCRKKHGRIVVLKLERSAAITNSEGRVFMDTQCPRCGKSENRRGVHEGFSVDQFIRFYDQAMSELRKTVRNMLEVILPELP
ncbi:MAG: hypothetical protein WBE46_06265 [Dehalococcoidia bacterium]